MDVRISLMKKFAHYVPVKSMALIFTITMLVGLAFAENETTKSEPAANNPPTATPEASPRPAPKRFVDKVPEGTQIIEDLEYVSDGGASQSLDIYLPPSSEKGDALRPLVVYIHGGGWRSGSKNDWHPSFRDLLENGFAVACISYRLTTKAPWPAQIHDSKAAVRWLRANAEEYKFDPNRIGVWGHSAGGHLAALIGTSGDVKELEGSEGKTDISSTVQAACNWSGPTDFTMAINEENPKWQFLRKLVIELLGGEEAAPKAAPAASPITYVNAKCPPFLSMIGEKDEVIPLQQVSVLHEALKKADVESTLIVVPNGDHGIAAPDNLKPVTEFFTKHLKK